MPRHRIPLLLLLFLLFVTEGCVIVDAPLLRLRTVAGGIHNRRRGVGIEPFFLPDGRLGCMVNGAVHLEEHPGGPLVEILPRHFEISDPAPSPDGRFLIFVAGREQVTAGGGHNDHVFQIYTVDLEAATDELDWRRRTESRRAESFPRFLPGGEEIVFVRRPDYDSYSLYEPPWGDGAIFRAATDGTNARPLTAPLFHPFHGLCVIEEGEALLFGASPEEGIRHLYSLALVEGAEPERRFEHASHPAVAATEEEVWFVRGHLGAPAVRETAYAAFDLCAARLDGSGERTLLAGRGEILGLAVSSAGDRVVFSEFDPDSGQFGAYGLFELDPAGGEPRLLHATPSRSKERFKVGDLVQPVTWWGRSDRFSPGSR